MSVTQFAAALLLLLPLLSCSEAPKPLEGAPLHHLDNGTFRNANGSQINKSTADLWRWRREAPEVEPITLPLATPNLASLQSPSHAAQITWIGHSTFLLQVDGLNILTDPIFSDRASPVRFAGPQRSTPPGLGINQLPPIDVVVISHNHYDHLDKPSVLALQAHQPDNPPRYIVPLRQKAWFDDLDIDNVVELDWWDRHHIAGITVHAVPVQHWSSRTPFDRNEVLWAGYVIDAPTLSTLFVGDSGYSEDFKAIAERLGPVDLALVPIGAYAPRWFMKSSHMNPDEALQVVDDVGASRAIAMHWGTFALTDEPMKEPAERLADNPKIDIALPGETIHLSTP